MAESPHTPAAPASSDHDAAGGGLATSAMPADLQDAWLFLARARTDDPFEHAIVYAAAEALVDVFPPYAPAEAPVAPVTFDSAITSARRSLQAAATASTSLEERLRVARALRLLSGLGASA